MVDLKEVFSLIEKESRLKGIFRGRITHESILLIEDLLIVFYWKRVTLRTFIDERHLENSPI